MLLGSLRCAVDGDNNIPPTLWAVETRVWRIDAAVTVPAVLLWHRNFLALIVNYVVDHEQPPVPKSIVGLCADSLWENGTVQMS